MGFLIRPMSDKNLADFAALCLNPENPTIHEGCRQRVEFLRARRRFGLDGFVAHDDEGRVAGFVDFVPAEAATAGVHADGYLFLQCLWVRMDCEKKGLGKKLLDSVISQITYQTGIVVVAHDNPEHMPYTFFERHGFHHVDTWKSLRLMVLPMRPGPLPFWRTEPLFASASSLAAQPLPVVDVFYTRLCPYNWMALQQLQTRLAGLEGRVCVRVHDAEQEPAHRVLGVEFSVFLEGENLAYSPLATDELVNRLHERLGGEHDATGTTMPHAGQQAGQMPLDGAAHQ